MSHSRNEHLRALVNYLPGGRMYSSALRKDSNLYNFLYGLSNELKKAGDYTERYHDNILPDSKPATFIELPENNVLLFINDETDSVWLGAATRAMDAAGVDGKEGTAATITDNSAVARENHRQAVTIADDSTPWTGSRFFKKDSDTTRFPELQLSLTGGTTQRVDAQLNTQTGEYVIRSSSTGVYSASIEDWGEWWRLIITVYNNGSGNTTATFAVLPANTDLFDTNNVSATGSIITDYPLLENTTEAGPVQEGAIGNNYDFLEEWEQALGIPDSCFPGNFITNYELRRIHILAKLASLGVQTEQDFIDLAALFGLTATISHTTKFEFDVETTVVETIAFPLSFPILFSVSQTGVYQCLVQILKPANTNVTFSTI